MGACPRDASPRDADPPGVAAVTGRTVRACVEPEPRADAGPPDAPGAAGRLAGSARSGTAGARCTVASLPANGSAPARRSRPGTGRADTGFDAPPSTEAGRPSSTAWEAVAMNDGFCQVGSRPPNAESATPAGPPATARWIGGSPVQAATTGARKFAGSAAPPVRAPLSEDSAAPPEGMAAVPSEGTAAVLVGVSPVRPLRNLSRNPTAQPSAPARVTKDAI
ncbi:hypothetical protein ABZ401_17555 [Streptomyces sp. NPDC005892]|uniref:hypothetical protein n=1 Tax=Streptomyces sp. NPDC005892 TaxID=3155593 RepID=UPI0033DE4D5C